MKLKILKRLLVKVETNGVEIKNFKKVVIIYNPNSGKQIFVSMLSRVLDLKRRLTAIIGPNRVELTELREFKKLGDYWSEQGGAYGAARV